MNKKEEKHYELFAAIHCEEEGGDMNYYAVVKRLKKQGNEYYWFEFTEDSYEYVDEEQVTDEVVPCLLMYKLVPTSK